MADDDLTFEEHSDAQDACACDVCDRVRARNEHASLQRFGASAGGLRMVHMLDLQLLLRE